MALTKLILPILRLSGLSRRWQMATYASVGMVIGLVVVSAQIANALSYLSDAPETCINCHVMTDAYANWKRGSHGLVAVCVDCHVPQSNIVAKVAFKSMDGMKHSYAFLMRKEPQVLRLSKMAAPVVQANCLRCHDNQLAMVRLAGVEERKCWDCHSNIHGEAHSLSASPSVLRPRIPEAGVDWMK